MSIDIECRPYPEYYNGNLDKAILRVFTGYYATRDGNIVNIKTGKVLRSNVNTGQVVLYLEKKPYNTSVQIQVLTAFQQKPAAYYTVDHIDPTKGSWHALENLRWADKKIQRANQNLRNLTTGNKRAIIATDQQGTVVTHDSVADWLIAIGKAKVGERKTESEKKAREAILAGTILYGFSIKNWVPQNTGEWRIIPADKNDGVQGYSASEFGGWIMSPWGFCSQGYKDLKTGRRRIGISRCGRTVSRFIYRLTAYAFLHTPDDTSKNQVNHKNGTLSGDANNLEWVTPRENVQHAHDMGLNYHGAPVAMYSLKGKKLWVFRSGREGLEFVKRSTKCKSKHASLISRCCTGKVKHAYGYVWKHEANNTGKRKGL